MLENVRVIFSFSNGKRGGICKSEGSGDNKETTVFYIKTSVLRRYHKQKGHTVRCGLGASDVT